MKTLAIVPARAGSKGVPGKNVRDFCGRPLVSWAIDVAKGISDGRPCVSTDDPDIERLAILSGAFVRGRPARLATDEAPMLAVVVDALSVHSTQPDLVVLLQPTSPLRTVEHVREALRLLEQTGADSVVSVTEIPEHYSPDFALEIVGHQRLRPWVQDDLPLQMCHLPASRQDCRPAYVRDGTVYVTRRSVIEAGSLYGDKCVPLIIPPNESANIDTEEDWKRAERIMRGRISVDCPCCLGDGSHDREMCSECHGGRMLPHEAEAWKESH
jgi:CMP-N-acetylneuraminic acid synthetase